MFVGKALLNNGPITCRVEQQGEPLSGIPIILQQQLEPGRWGELATGTTDGSGLAHNLLPVTFNVDANAIYRLIVVQLPSSMIFPTIEVSFGPLANPAALGSKTLTFHVRICLGSSSSYVVERVSSP